MTSIVPKKRAYNSTIRRVTACLECSRRKQKCNRETPCNICIDRGVTERCIYQTDSPKTEVDLETSFSRKPEIQDSRLTVDECGLSALSTGLGYQTRSTAFNEVRPFGRSARPNLSSKQLLHYQRILDQLPEARTVQKLVNVFFENANWYFTVLQSGFFNQSLRDWQLWRHKNQQEYLAGEMLFFPALLFQVLAMAIQFIPPDLKLDLDIHQLLQPTHDQAAQRFSDAGENLLTLTGRKQPELSSIEADIMRCAWLKNSGNGYDAWYALGNALRSAQEMGLHLEPSESKHDHGSENWLCESWQNEHKRCVWSTLFSWEAHMALQLGRPRMINVTDCTVKRPKGCEAPKIPSMTWLRNPQGDEPPSLYHSQLVKHDSAVIIHKALSAGLLISSANLTAEIDSMHDEIEAMVARLPPSLRLKDPDRSWDLLYPHIVQQRIQVAIMVDSLLLALHRPHVSACVTSLDTAVMAAKRVLDHSQDLLDIAQPHHYRAYSLIFYTIDAGIFLAAIVCRFDKLTLPAASILATLNAAVQRLCVLKTHHSAAIAGEKVLTSCLNQVEHKLKPPQDNAQYLSTETQIAHMPQGFDDYDELFARIMNDSAFTSSWMDESFEAFAAAGVDLGGPWISMSV